MPDYKEMYLKMARATEKAMDILIEAQQEAEDLYLSAPDQNIILFTEKENSAKQDNSEEKNQITEEDGSDVKNQKLGSFY